MNISRREMTKTIPLFAAVGLLVACGTNGSTTAVPTLAQVQSWVGIINTELPVFIAESESNGILTGAADNTVKSGLATFQQLATQVLSPTFSITNSATVVAEIGNVLTTIASVIPVAAPYIGLIQLAVTVISSFVALIPITVPAIPSSTQLASIHTSNLKFHP